MRTGMPSQETFKRFSQLAGMDLEYFFKSGFSVSVRYAIVSLSGVVASIGFARLGSKELLGQYQSVLALLGLLSVFSLPGLNMAAFKAVIEGFDEGIIKAVKYSFFSSLLGLPILFGYAGYQFYFLGHQMLAQSLILGALFFPFFYAANTWYVYYEARSHFSAVSVRVIFASVLTTIALVCSLYFQAGLFVVVGVYLFFGTFLNWFFFFEVKKKISRGKVKTGSLDINYGLSVSAQKFVFSLTENLPALAIPFLFGFASLAVFQIAYFVINAVAGFLNGLSATYLPLLFRSTSLNHWKVLFQNLVLGVILFFILRMFLNIFFLPLYGIHYQESLAIANNLSFLVMLFPIKIFLSNFLTVKKKNFLLSLLLLVANAMSLLALYLTKGLAFSTSMCWYMYTLHFTLLIPLLAVYMRLHLKKEAGEF